MGKNSQAPCHRMSKTTYPILKSLAYRHKKKIKINRIDQKALQSSHGGKIMLGIPVSTESD